jgi:DNA-directed RNA polymerase subunit RPC12/RpoP
MVFYNCPECDKSFKDGVDLFNHIENYHRQIAILMDNKCPYCESEGISQIGFGKNGDVSFKTGEIQGDEYKIYFCTNCKHLSKNI